MSEVSLKDRRILGDEGFVSVIVVVDLADGKIVAGPDLHARGFADDDGASTTSGPVEAALEARCSDDDDRPHQLAAGHPPDDRQVGVATPTAAAR